jgi:hypothetical protein
LSTTAWFYQPPFYRIAALKIEDEDEDEDEFEDDRRSLIPHHAP